MPRLFLLFAFTALYPAQAISDVIHFSCRWGWGNTVEADGRDGGSAYPASFILDTSTQTAISGPAKRDYVISAVTTQAVWLRKSIMSEKSINIVTISRSSDGGAWTDTVLQSDGTVTTVSGGYCKESEN